MLTHKFCDSHNSVKLSPEVPVALELVVEHILHLVQATPATWQLSRRQRQLAIIFTLLVTGRASGLRKKKLIIGIAGCRSVAAYSFSFSYLGQLEVVGWEELCLYCESADTKNGFQPTCVCSNCFILIPLFSNCILFLLISRALLNALGKDCRPSRQIMLQWKSQFFNVKLPTGRWGEK